MLQTVFTFFVASSLVIIGIFSGWFGLKKFKVSVPLLCCTVVAGAVCISPFSQLTWFEVTFVYLAIICALATFRYQKMGLLWLMFLSGWLFGGSIVVEITQLIDNPTESLFRRSRLPSSPQPAHSLNSAFLFPDLALFLERCTVFGFLRLRKNNYLSMLQWLASLPWFFLYVKHPECTALGVFAVLGNWLAVLGACKCVGMLLRVRCLADWEPKVDFVSLALLLVWLVALGGGIWMQYRQWTPNKTKDQSTNPVQPDTKEAKVDSHPTAHHQHQ